jgi:hypothetical protein
MTTRTAQCSCGQLAYPYATAWPVKGERAARSASGATVYYSLEGAESLIAVPVGAFADPKFRSPTVSVDERRKHSWVQLPVEFEHDP